MRYITNECGDCGTCEALCPTGAIKSCAIELDDDHEEAIRRAYCGEDITDKLWRGKLLDVAGLLSWIIGGV